MRRMKGALIFGLCIALLFCYAGGAKAEEDLAVGGNAVVRLDFRITIPTILYLQVGSAGPAIDRVDFDVDDVPGTGAILGVTTGPSPVPVRVAALIGAASTATLEADSSNPLTDGTNTIPFSEISWTATGAFSGNAFNGTATQQLDQFTGPGNRTGTYSFSYANANYYPASTYNGQVTYTLSSP